MTSPQTAPRAHVPDVLHRPASRPPRRGRSWLVGWPSGTVRVSVITSVPYQVLPDAGELE